MFAEFETNVQIKFARLRPYLEELNFEDYSLLEDEEFIDLVPKNLKILMLVFLRSVVRKNLDLQENYVSNDNASKSIFPYNSKLPYINLGTLPFHPIVSDQLLFHPVDIPPEIILPQKDNMYKIDDSDSDNLHKLE